MGRALRRGLVRLIRFFVIRPVRLVGLVALLLAGVLALALVPSPGLGFPRWQAPPLSVPRATGTEPSATEDYMKGNQDYRADLVWNSLSDDARQRLLSQGNSEEDLAQQMAAAKETGLKLEDVTYIGGKALPDGRSMQFYVVAVRVQAQPDPDYVPYMFTLDPDGKISKVQ